MRPSRTLLLPFLCLSLALLCGCGGSATPAARAIPLLNLNGNWEVVGLSPIAGATFTHPIANFAGALQSTNSTVTGTLRAFDLNLLGACVVINQDLYATGTLSPDGNLILTIPISGGIATITTTLSQDLEAYAMGTFQISGGPCAMPSTTMAMNQYAAVTGTYTGTLAGVGSTDSSTVTAVLVQATEPDADGRFPLTGRVTSQGTCTGTLPLAAEVVSGNGILDVTTGSITAYAAITGPITPPASSINAFVVLYYSSPACGYLRGTLTRQ